MGLSQADIRMCAGFPQRTSRESDGSEIWSYETAVSSGGVTVNAPVLFGAASTSVSMKPGGGNCRAQIRFVDGRAVRLTYAGDNDTSYGRNTVCAPIVAACVDYAREIAPAPAMSAAPASISVRTPDAAPPDPGRYSSSP
ncbi:hypothetical protein OSH11_20150 [Kaistia dalseonensis]|uniref:Uncharacterized protein n=1 Tax=Kaistia dalseonensis TaxID=410840 RepID=A0ABU0HBG5_9HYPH|nr:hypothetical protein [Kaistia dalseonensis]MCX5497028.1 hypothetical protein [Kaistia dalseonensis]MDQ0439654.1 hypothetical protein [Kaistia dalseonensis]